MYLPKIDFVQKFAFISVPVAVVLMLYYTGILDCSNISTPYMICIYISMTNRYEIDSLHTFFLVTVMAFSFFHFRGFIVDLQYSCFKFLQCHNIQRTGQRISENGQRNFTFEFMMVLWK